MTTDRLRNCEQCNDEFYGRADAKYCGNSCRQKAWRAREASPCECGCCFCRTKRQYCGRSYLHEDSSVPPATMQGDAGPEYYRHRYLMDLVKWVAEEADLSMKYSPADVESMLQEFIAEHGRMPR